MKKTRPEKKHRRPWKGRGFRLQVSPLLEKACALPENCSLVKCTPKTKAKILNSRKKFVMACPQNIVGATLNPKPETPNLNPKP